VGISAGNMEASLNAARFVTSTFRSVWSLELVLYLRQSAHKAFSATELVAALRASDAVVSKGIDGLLAAGLIVEEGEGKVRYAPVSSDLDRVVEKTEQLYKVRPDAVRRLIVRGSTGGLAAFADAFKLRGD
jgi:hypothetical protein